MKIYLGTITTTRNGTCHALDEDGWLLCRGRGNRDALDTFVGYPFDVQCKKCQRLLAEELSPQELESADA